MKINNGSELLKKIYELIFQNHDLFYRTIKNIQISKPQMIKSEKEKTYQVIATHVIETQMEFRHYNEPDRVYIENRSQIIYDEKFDVIGFKKLQKWPNHVLSRKNRTIFDEMKIIRGYKLNDLGEDRTCLFVSFFLFAYFQ